jgi:hypothetical protein
MFGISLCSVKKLMRIGTVQHRCHLEGHTWRCMSLMGDSEVLMCCTKLLQSLVMFSGCYIYCCKTLDFGPFVPVLF